MTASASRTPGARHQTPDVISAAFRDLHGHRLHGFALLLTLNDAELAGRLAGDALRDGTRRVGRLRHPERGAAWLRSHVVVGARKAGRMAWPHGATELVDDRLGVDSSVLKALGKLSRIERAAVIAWYVERFGRGDAETIVGRRGRRFDTLLHTARSKYVASYTSTDAPAQKDGPFVGEIRSIVARVIE